MQSDSPHDPGTTPDTNTDAAAMSGFVFGGPPRHGLCSDAYDVDWSSSHSATNQADAQAATFTTGRVDEERAR